MGEGDTRWRSRRKSEWLRDTRVGLFCFENLYFLIEINLSETFKFPTKINLSVILTFERKYCLSKIFPMKNIPSEITILLVVFHHNSKEKRVKESPWRRPLWDWNSLVGPIQKDQDRTWDHATFDAFYPLSIKPNLPCNILILDLHIINILNLF